MWLITTLFFALTATVLWYALKKKYKLGFLSLMLWGATIMMLVDHVLVHKGGPLLEFETDGLISNATLLGLLMLVPVFIAWLIALGMSKFKKPMLKPKPSKELDCPNARSERQCSKK